MNLFLLEPRYINKPWKVMLLLYGIDGAMRFPLRFFKPHLSIESLLSIRFLIFLIAIFLVGLLYVKSTKKSVDKKLRFRVAMYVTLISLAAWFIFTYIFGELFVRIFGGLFENLLVAVLTFLAVYFILPLSNRFVKKK